MSLSRVIQLLLLVFIAGFLAYIELSGRSREAAPSAVPDKPETSEGNPVPVETASQPKGGTAVSSTPTREPGIDTSADTSTRNSLVPDRHVRDESPEELEQRREAAKQRVVEELKRRLRENEQ